MNTYTCCSCEKIFNDTADELIQCQNCNMPICESCFMERCDMCEDYCYKCVKKSYDEMTLEEREAEDLKKKNRKKHNKKKNKSKIVKKTFIRNKMMNIQMEECKKYHLKMYSTDRFSLFDFNDFRNLQVHRRKFNETLLRIECMPPNNVLKEGGIEYQRHMEAYDTF